MFMFHWADKGWRTAIDQEPVEDQGFLHVSPKINAWNVLRLQSHTIIGGKLNNPNHGQILPRFQKTIQLPAIFPKTNG